MDDNIHQSRPGAPFDTAAMEQHHFSSLSQALRLHTPVRRDSYRRNSLPAVGTSSPISRSGHDFAGDDHQNQPSAKDISAAISELSIRAATPQNVVAALTSPCFFHRRFGDAVNIEKVLEEIKEDDQLSHSRLMQTAAGVREVSRQLQRRAVKQAVKSVMIITKARDNSLVELTRELTEWLLTKPRYGKDVGVNVYVDSKLRKSKRFDADGLTAKDGRFEKMLRYWTPGLCWQSPELFDLVITLGGDGTVLFTSWLFQRIVPPVMSFSLGSLGFLTNFQFNAYKEQLDRIMGDAGMRVTMRMRFTCTVYRSAHTPQTPTASSTSLSTAASESTPLHPVDSSSSTTSGPQSSKIEGETHEPRPLRQRLPLTRISADGIILSTPTGSTAYSLSAGGSLIYPDIPAILLTPICPHTLSFRPMILNDSMELKVSIPERGRGGAFVSFDGKGRVELGRGDEVVVRASRYPFPTVLSQPMEWFDSGRGSEGVERDGEEEDEGAAAQGEVRKEPVFDIDFEDDEDSVRDSGYSGASSTV
ncbi:NAD(+) kinase [Taxawa tesnikishii (nom. ined.)]|nr:NAD(+) kinase [Dothideales sp. JES 119]